MLTEGNKKGILLPAETRWGTTYMMINRVLEIYAEINKVILYLVQFLV